MKRLTKQGSIIIGVILVLIVIVLSVWSNNSSRSQEQKAALFMVFSSIYVNAIESVQGREYEDLTKAFQNYIQFYLDDRPEILNNKYWPREGRQKFKGDIVKLQCMWKKRNLVKNIKPI